MIKTLHIENFQSHENTELVFSENFTAIRGLNNHGKSAILRALKKIVRDEPSGDSFIQDNKNYLRITVETDRGKIERVLKRDSSSNSNMYIVNDTDEFVKFSKHGVPKEVRDTLHVSDTQSFGDSDFDVNFHNQLDSLFLIVGQGLPSLRGRILSKITSIDKIQNAFSYVVLEEKRESQKKKDFLAEISSVNSHLESLSSLDSQILEFQKFQDSYSEYLRHQAIFQEIQGIVQEVKSILSESRLLVQKIKLLDIDLSESLEKLESLRSLISEITDVLFLEEQISIYSNVANQNIPSSTKFLLDKIESIQLVKELVQIEQDTLYCEEVCNLSLPEITELQNRVTVVLSVRQCIEESESYLDKIQKLESSLDSTVSEYSEADRSLRDLRRELKVCPVCNKLFEEV